nr:MAG TPA: hypothetical protein [Caudoviricetes sp.]
MEHDNKGGDSRLFLRVLPVEWPCHGAGASRKKASFCIFIHHHHLSNVLNLNEIYFYYVNFGRFLFNI